MTQTPTEPMGHKDEPSEPSWGDVLAFPLGIFGAIIGGTVGGWAFTMVWRQGYYAPVLVEALAGFGAIALARRGGWALAIPTAPIALLSGLIAQWCVKWWRDDPSLGYFLLNVHRLKTSELAFHAIGVVVAIVIVMMTPTQRRIPDEPPRQR